MSWWEWAVTEACTVALSMAELLKRSADRIDHLVLGSPSTGESTLRLPPAGISTSMGSADGFTLGQMLAGAEDAERSSDPLKTEPAHSAARIETLELLVGIQRTLSQEAQESTDFEVIEALTEATVAILDVEDRLRHG